jgi:hypothetical protein
MPSGLETTGPPPGTVLELIPASSGDALVSWSEELVGDVLVVSAPLDLSQRPLSLPPGEHLDVIWRGPDDLRALPAVLVAAEFGERPWWRLRSAGVARRGQRRDAVRAPLTIPVRVGPEPAPITGNTIDVSEGGLRCLLDDPRRRGRRPSDQGSGDVPPPRVGDVVHVAAMFPDFTITCLSEVTRRHDRDDARPELSLRFIGLTENQQDLVRRRVFGRLRDLRYRGLL